MRPSTLDPRLSLRDGKLFVIRRAMDADFVLDLDKHPRGCVVVVGNDGVIDPEPVVASSRRGCTPSGLRPSTG